ncbi:hypothetical protein ACH3XW_14200 [Acanthocheilonema viteae]
MRKKPIKRSNFNQVLILLWCFSLPKEQTVAHLEKMESGNLNGSRILYMMELIDAVQTISPAVILTLLIFLEIALAIFTSEYVKNFMNKSIKHLQSIDQKPSDVENIEQVSQTITDAARSEIQQFSEGIKRISEALMSNQILFKLLMDEEINRETMRMIYGTAS